ncbi:hypothetical protein BGX34_007514 [Mortierella sp. NVP85]|nr:hypothetical protein BGX34_007514 [Mortierella sp. NVP85]
MGPVVPAPSPTPVTPDPVFSTSDACVACKGKYATVRTCSSRIPVAGNLTMISQVLPFYQCICADNGSAIDALQQCSICLRSTGQQVFLNRAFYNVTNQDVKAMKEVCEDTANGTKVPSSSSGRWDMILSSASWGVVAIGALLLAPLGGL